MRGSAGPAVGPATGFVPRGDQQFRWPVERDPTRRFPDPARRGDCGSGRHRSHVRKRRISETLWARVRAEASTVLTRTRRPRGMETRGGRAADPRRAGPCGASCPLPLAPQSLVISAASKWAARAHTTLTRTLVHGAWAHTHVGVERSLKSARPCRGAGAPGGWGGGSSGEPLPFPGRRARAAWSKEKKEGGQEEAIVLFIVSCQEDEMASGSK